jgi:hypothetical protein
MIAPGLFFNDFSEFLTFMARSFPFSRKNGHRRPDIPTGRGVASMSFRRGHGQYRVEGLSR